MTIKLPRFLHKEKKSKNYINELKIESLNCDVNITQHLVNRVNGYIATIDNEDILISPSKTWAEIRSYEKVLYLKELNLFNSIEDCLDEEFQWIKHPLITQQYNINEINESWENSLTLRKENREREIKGLRTP